MSPTRRSNPIRQLASLDGPENFEFESDDSHNQVNLYSVYDKSESPIMLSVNTEGVAIPMELDTGSGKS